MQISQSCLTKILTNLGHHYNNTTGIFYVPVTGTYMFYANILSEVDNYIETELLVNGNLLAEIFSGPENTTGPEVTSSSSIWLKGDNVWVKVQGNYSSNMAVHIFWLSPMRRDKSWSRTGCWINTMSLLCDVQYLVIYFSMGHV